MLEIKKNRRKNYSSFKYILDPWFLCCYLTYIINKILILHFTSFQNIFYKYYLNDILLLPVALPVILYLAKILKLRPNNQPPTIFEITLPLFIWSLMFEWIAPNFFDKGVSDLRDVLAYIFGGYLSWFIWHINCFNSNKLIDKIKQ